jgi:PAS domain S-box-containing protein
VSSVLLQKGTTVELFHHLFGPSGFMPHGYCYLWNTRLVWLHVVSDGLIALAYLAIPIVLVWFVRKRRDLPFSWMFVLFGVFIVACGFTHMMEIWNLWHADYWLAGAIKAITAAASVATATLLARLMPRLVRLPNLKQWISANADLEKEIHERREIELDLRVSEANYREQAELLELTHDAIFVRAFNGKIIYWNRGAERLYGWLKDDARGKIAHELLQTKFPKPAGDIISEVVEAAYWEGELIHRRRDGAEITVASRWALRTDASGEPAAILESNRDITLRKIEGNKFRNLLESAPDAIVIVNGAGEIQLVNAQTERIFGYSRQEMIGHPVELLVPHRFHAQHAGHRQDYSKALIPRAMGVGLELFGRRKDGSEFPVEISLSPLQTQDGTLISSAIRDVTERRATEAQIRKLNAELNLKLAELATVNRELESFSYSVSHDLRAPLRHVDGFTRILKDEYALAIPEEGRRYLDRVLEAANHMGHLVDDLLNLARIGRHEMVKQPVNLATLLRQSLAELPEEAENRDIEWRIEPLPEMDCDPGLLKLVFINLLSNAAKFTRGRQAAVIEVGTREIDGITALFVRDNGVGFDPKYADKLFGVFQRLHKQEDFEGTGIGLATVQRIIKRHGGEIWAESELGHGATFTFTLASRPLAAMMNAPKEAYLGRA